MIRLIFSLLFIFAFGKAYNQSSFQELTKLKGIDRVNGFEDYYYQNLKQELPQVVINYGKIIENMSGNDKELFMVFRYIELLYWTERDEGIDLRNKYGKELDSLFKIMPTNETLAYLKSNYENIYGYSMFLEKGTPASIQLLQNSILFFQQKGFENVANLSNKITKLGNVYFKNMMYEDALYCFTQAVKYNPKAIDRDIGIHAYNGLGLSCKGLRQYDAAINAFNEAKKLADKSSNFLAVGFLMGNIANCYLKLGKLEEARETFLAEIKLLDDASISANSLSLAEAYSGLTLIAALNNQKEQANLYATKSDSYIKLIDSTELKRYYETCITYNENMTLAFKQLGENEKSLMYAIWWLDALKGLNESTKSTEISRLATEFNTESYKIQKKEAEDKRKIVSNWLIASVIVNLLVIILLLYRYLKSKKRSKEMEENASKHLVKQKETDILLAELHEKEESMKMSLSNQDAQLQLLTQELVEKLAMIEDLNTQLATYRQKEMNEDLVYDKTTKMIEELKFLVITEKNWERFIVVLEQAYPQFLSTIQTEIPALTPADIRLLALLKLKLDIRQISEILGISVSSIYTSKYRLRQKVKHLPQGDEIITLLK